MLTWLVSGLKEANKFISHLISEKDPKLVKHPWLTLLVVIIDQGTERDNWIKFGELTAIKRLSVKQALKDLKIKEADWTMTRVMKRALLLDPSQPMTPLYWQLFFAQYFSVTTEGRVFGHVLLRHDKLKYGFDTWIRVTY